MQNMKWSLGKSEVQTIVWSFFNQINFIYKAHLGQPGVKQ